jgi:hypothetical protein
LVTVPAARRVLALSSVARATSMLELRADQHLVGDRRGVERLRDREQDVRLGQLVVRLGRAMFGLDRLQPGYAAGTISGALKLTTPSSWLTAG